MGHHHFICTFLQMFLMICCCCTLLLAVNQSQFFTEMKKTFSGDLSAWYTANGTNNFCSYRGVGCNNQGNVEMIDISGWWLSGHFPEDVCLYLPQLKILRLDDNDLNGSFPVGILNCSLLEVLDMSHANLKSTLPDLSPLQSLKSLDLSLNHFDGEFPMSLAKIKNLESVNFHGDGRFYNVWELPENISEIANLREIISYSCNLHGKIPASIGNMTSLVHLDLSDNALVGQLPPEMGRQLINLQNLNLSHNQLEGEIPQEFSNMIKLTSLDISDNKLTKFPEALLALPHASSIDLSYNCLNGSISRRIGNAKNLSQLLLQNNSISGFLPAEITEAINLVEVNVSNNLLSGPIPSEIGNLRKLLYLDLSDNNFTGGIPKKIGNAKSLVRLLLQNNSISGFLPAEISEAVHLMEVDLGNNHLSGPIPPEIGNLGMLHFLDLSGNNFTGCIPKSISSKPNLVFWSDNPNSNFCSQTYNNKKSSPILSIGLPIIIVFVVSVLFLFRWLWFKKDTAITENKDAFLSSFFGAVVDICHYDEIFQSMIDSNIVGRGGYGTVYKVELSNGSTVAVKKLQSGTSEMSEPVGLDKELRAEADTLGSIRHRNIVKLYCYFSSAEGSLLVYEFMPNGNLWDALHGGNKLLNWPIRYHIALGAAQGLAHLHHHHPAPIIHRDIKSSNILLDSEYNPKVADFGLAKILEERRGKQSISTGAVAGTFGYLDPEYALTHRASTKGDVYSFGVVLMELVTGRKPVETVLFGEGNNIINWIRNNVENRETGLEVLDQRISESFEDGMLKVLLLSMHCTHGKKASRPTMDEVVELLLRAAGPSTSSEQISNISFSPIKLSDTLPLMLVR